MTHRKIKSLEKQLKSDEVPIIIQMCRVCLCETNGADPKLETTLLMFHNPQEIRTMLQESTGVQIDNLDFLPNHICSKCLRSLKGWYKFRSQMQRSNEILKKYLRKRNNKLDCNSFPSKNPAIHMLDGTKMNVVPEENIQQIDGFKVTILKDKQPEEIGIVLHCNSCTMTFTNQIDLDCHTEEHNNRTTKEKSFKCEYCGKLFSLADGLRNHTEIYHSGYKNENYQCSLCERVFRTPNGLKYHQSKLCVSLKLIKQCTICPMSEPLEELIEAGEKAIRETKISCILCKENFENHNDFVFHYPKHNHNLRCSICQKVLRNVKLLERHVRMHLGVKVYTCPICSQSFYTRHVMRAHIQNHAKKDIYRCNVCQTDFFNLKKFEKHMIKHLAVVQDKIKTNDFLDAAELKNVDNIEIDNECDSMNSDEDDDDDDDDELTTEIELDSSQAEEEFHFVKKEIHSDGEASDSGKRHQSIEIPPINLIDTNDKFQIIKSESDMKSTYEIESYNPTDFDDSNKIQTEFLNTTKGQSEISDLNTNVKLEKLDLDASDEEDHANESDDNSLKSESNEKLNDSETEKYYKNLLNLVKVTCHVPGCQKICSNFGNTMFHFTNDHLANMETPYECLVCFEKFKNKKLIKQHSRKYYTFKCPVCLKVHKSFPKLSKHVRCSHLSDRFKCSICDKRFGLPGNLKIHMTTHSFKKLFVCNVCQKEFHSTNGLYLHSKSHLNIKELQCHNCGRQAASKSRLMKHTANCVKHKRSTSN